MINLVTQPEENVTQQSTIPKIKGFRQQGTGSAELDKLIAFAGYAYDAKQNIFYSILDPWQRYLGYCRLYDEAAAPLGMIIDCEPVHFEYRKQKWMIAFWKGQYDLVTGAEIGLYNEGTDLAIFGFKDTFYSCPSLQDLLDMSFVLKKNGKVLFSRKDRHWWLTGFALGEFSEPAELTMDIEITLRDDEMLGSFIEGLKKAGYSTQDLKIKQNTVYLTFDNPRSSQPFTRTETSDRLIQKKNKLLCDKYQEITEPFSDLADKVEAIREQAPELYNRIVNIGKAKPSFEMAEAALIILIVSGVFISARLFGSKDLPSSD